MVYKKKKKLKEIAFSFIQLGRESTWQYWQWKKESTYYKNVLRHERRGV